MILTLGVERGTRFNPRVGIPFGGRIFSSDYITGFPGRELVCSFARSELRVRRYVSTGDESKMNRRRKSRRPRAISTENFVGEFTLAYLMAPLHHQRATAAVAAARPPLPPVHSATKLRPALTLMMRNHVRQKRSFTCITHYTNAYN
jgi:hypothetical protein